MLVIKSYISYFVTRPTRHFKKDQPIRFSHSEGGQSKLVSITQDHDTKAVYTGVGQESERTRINLPGPAPGVLLPPTRPHLSKVSRMPFPTNKQHSPPVTSI